MLIKSAGFCVRHKYEIDAFLFAKFYYFIVIHRARSGKDGFYPPLDEHFWRIGEWKEAVAVSYGVLKVRLRGESVGKLGRLVRAENCELAGADPVLLAHTVAVKSAAFRDGYRITV